jgi:hypothetical protein
LDCGRQYIVHPGARPTNGLVQKMVRFLWQELDEVGDFGRFPVKKRPRDRTFWTCWERAPSARFSHAMARRLGPRTAANEFRDYGGHAERHAVARCRAHLTTKFQLAIGARISNIAAKSREISRQRVVHGDRSYASGFESVLFIGRLLSTA